MRPRLAALLVALLALAPALPCAGQAEQAPLGLDDLLQRALEHDGRVLAARAQLDAYRAHYDLAWWSWFPVIQLQGLFGGPVGERKLKCPERDDCVELNKNWRPGSFDFGQMSFAVGGKLEAAVPLYTFGKISEAKRAARAGVQAGEADIRRARQEVALEVRRAWYGLQLARCSASVLDDGVAKIEDAEKKLLKMLEELNEEVTDRDLYKLRYYAAEVKKRLAQARQGQRIAEDALRFLTGEPALGAGIALAEVELELPADSRRSRQDWLDRAFAHRPELEMLESALEASRAAVEVEKSMFYPDFFLAGFLQGSYSPAHDYIANPLLNNGYTNYDAGLTLGFRVTFDLPQKLARLDKARAELRKLEAQAGQAERAVGLELDQGLADYEAALARAALMKKGHRSAKTWMRANLMSYGVGLTNTKDLLDSVAAYAQSRIELAMAVHDAVLSRDRLLAIAGEDLGRSAAPGE
ncbi:MAG: TolC family protein [Deltaproteobacteria bacterium]|nr:TolC family protein [Deltaproteobacteria bacterium]